MAQFPNAPLIVFLAAVAVRWIYHPTGTGGTVITVIAAIALIIWAGDEVIRGVNPWRRILGGVILAVTVVGVFMR